MCVDAAIIPLLIFPMANYTFFQSNVKLVQNMISN